MIFVDLNNEIAKKAINGDHEAQEYLLKRYDKYINKVSTVTTFNKYGVPCRYVDEDLKAEVQMKYLIELSKCEVCLLYTSLCV